MKKKELEIILEKLRGFENPKIELEQYTTPPSLAAFIVTTADLNGDLELVVDLGCGTGILAIACSLLGYYSVGVDLDVEALKIARENATRLGVDADFARADVSKFHCKKKVTTVMNPPFGIQRKHADRPFLLKAFEISEVIYTIHSAGSSNFVKRLSEEHGFAVTHQWNFSIPLRRTYSFHEKAFKYIPVEVFRIERHEIRDSGR
uniref:Methyltransferase domain-containing protein n=1 Tax=Archaeoglobus fulgidus TaxID=2234 RepID=A0A7C3VDM1_ARCFL